MSRDRVPFLVLLTSHWISRVGLLLVLTALCTWLLHFPGCFRCHGGDHVDADAKPITNHCFACHFTAAVDEAEPEVLQTLGIEKVLAKVRKQ